MTWTLEQAAELVIEQFLEMLDGCDDDDTVRPALILEAIREAWAPQTRVEPLPDGATAGMVRAGLRAARVDLARGATIP